MNREQRIISLMEKSSSIENRAKSVSSLSRNNMRLGLIGEIAAPVGAVIGLVVSLSRQPGAGLIAEIGSVTLAIESFSLRREARRTPELIEDSRRLVAEAVNVINQLTPKYH